MKPKKRFVNTVPQSDRRNKAYRLIATGLKELGATGYDELFRHIWPTLREIYEASGEEMMRLRIYEFLQNMVSRGDISKDGKTYTVTANGEKLIEDDGGEIVLGLGDVNDAALGMTYEKLKLSDFRKPMADFHSAAKVVFDDGKGYRRVLKDRLPGEEVSSD